MYKALFLLAGSGNRLKPLTNNQPKSLIEINGKSLLTRSLDYLKANNILDIVIVTGYMKESIHQFINSNYADLSVQFINNELYNSTNNSYSLYLANQAYKSESMILLDGDILYERIILDSLLVTNDASNYLAVRASNDLSDEEMKVILDENQFVSQIDKKLDPKSSFGESLGIAKFSTVFTQKLFQILEKRMIRQKRVNEYYEASFQELIDSGEKIGIVETARSKCCEIDTLEDLDFARREIAPIVDK